MEEPLSVKVCVLIATVPWRRAACQALIGALPEQTRPPDVVSLYLDGSPISEGLELPDGLEAVVYAAGTTACHGPGARWSRPGYEDEILVVLDDDVDIRGCRTLLEQLVAPVERADVCTAAAGVTPGGALLHWHSRYTDQPPFPCDGRLVTAIASAMAVRAHHLSGLGSWIAGLTLPFDVLGPGGDDEAAVSAYLWTQGVPIQHIRTEGLRLAPGTQERSQVVERMKHEKAHRLPGDWQRRALREACGWPWPEAR